MAVVAVKILLLYIPASTTTPVNNNTHLRAAPNVITQSSCCMPSVRRRCSYWGHQNL